MKLLAIDASTDRASIALLVDDVYSSMKQDSQKTHAQVLLPMIDQLLTDRGVLLSQLDGIVFGCGPGSFTGIRIACSIAKGLAYAHALRLIPVCSLDAIAFEARRLGAYQHMPVLSVLDARMQELYWGYYEAHQTMATVYVTPAKDIKLPLQSSLLLAGVGIETYWPHIPESITSQVQHTLEVYPLAQAMIRLACFASIKAVDAAIASPMYVRNQVTHGESHG
jgi:tRNA threonylcarbamoyladenosine biosynthesis protein TsaB